jgi:hypothetical protein
MYNPNNTKEIVFPHFLPTAKFGDKVYTWNDVTGGAKTGNGHGLYQASMPWWQMRKDGLRQGTWSVGVS